VRAIMPSLAAAFAATSAHADISSFETRGFTVTQSFEIAAPPETVFDAATGDVSGWWDHSFSRGFGQMPDELSIEPRAGGAFLERFGDGAEVLHATVIYAKRPETLRMDGPLGFSGLAAQFVITYELAEIEGGTRFDLTVNASGQIDEAGAAALEGVWSHFIGGRLKPYVEAGCHETPEAPCPAFEDSGAE